VRTNRCRLCQLPSQSRTSSDTRSLPLRWPLPVHLHQVRAALRRSPTAQSPHRQASASQDAVACAGCKAGALFGAPARLARPHLDPGRCRLAASSGWYNWRMDVAAVERPTRLPRFRRASEPPAFRLTDDDVEIVRQVARHRLLRSTHIAALVGRSLDRTNDRCCASFTLGMSTVPALSSTASPPRARPTTSMLLPTGEPGYCVSATVSASPKSSGAARTGRLAGHSSSTSLRS
jgi:hypothetical protein